MSLIHTSPLARLPLHVTAGTTALVVNVMATWVGTVGTADFGVGVYVDGVYSQELSTVANGVTQFTVSLDGSAHDIDLVNSYRNDIVGAFAYSYTATGGTATVRGVATPATKWCLYTDSIGTGAYATIITKESYAARLQNLLPLGAFSLEGFGGRGLFTDNGPAANQYGLGGCGSLQNLAARFAYHLRGATTKNVVMCIGVNDALYSGTGLWSSANFGAAMGTLLDAIHALDATIHVYLISPIITGEEATLNSFSETIAAYRAVLATAAAARTGFVTFTAGTNLMAVGGLSSGAGDGILHPGSLGHQSIYDGTGGFAGSTNLRAVLGV